jgi:hypothetical protein
MGLLLFIGFPPENPHSQMKRIAGSISLSYLIEEAGGLLDIYAKPRIIT